MHPLRLLSAIGLCVVLVGAASFATRPAGAFNYVVNGDFESGTDGWTLGPNTWFEAVQQSDSPSGATGSTGRFSLDAVRGNTTFSIQQSSVAGTPAGDYVFAARVWLSSYSTNVWIQVGSSPSVTFAKFFAAPASGEWMEVGGLVHVTGFTNLSITVGGSGSLGDVVYVDSIRFDGADPATMTPTETPVPPTSSHTPLPPTGTRTPKPTNTPKPTSTAATTQETPAGGATAGAVLTGPPATLHNGGFEEVAEGAPLSWEKYGGSLSSATSPVRSGGYAARLESTTESTKWAYQTVQVTPGQAYEFSAWLNHDDPAIASAFLRISWYESSDGSGTALGTADSTLRLDARSPDWRQLTTGAVGAPLDAHSAKVRVMLQPSTSARAALYVDDAHFGETAEPVAAASGASSTGSPGQPAAPAGRTSSSLDGATHVQSQGRVGDVTVVINEVLYDSMSNPDGTGEWIEFYNPGDRAVSLEGWAIADNRSADVIDSLTVPARGYAILASQKFTAMHPSVDAALEMATGTIGNSLGNEGDLVVLVDPTGRFVDAISWGSDTGALDPAIADVPEGHSIERRMPGADSDRADDFADNEAPSPGEAYEAPRVAGVAGHRAPGADIEILNAAPGRSFAWLPWALAATSMAALAGVASWRVLPSLAQRLRHQ